MKSVLGRGFSLLALFVLGFFKDRKGQLMLALGILPVVVIIITGIAPSAPGQAMNRYIDTIGSVYGAILVPLLGLLLGMAALSDEIESHTIVQLVSRPITRVEILIWRYIATLIAGTLMLIIATSFLFGWFALVAGLGAESMSLDLLPRTWAYIGLCNAVYCAIFMLLGIALKRPLFWGVIVALYEQLLGVIFSFIGGQAYSLSAHIRNVGRTIFSYTPGSWLIDGWTPEASGIILLALVAGSLIIAAFLFKIKDLS